jgi:uncharacterized membrane protein YdbT with pleckstrin-like domain
MIFEILGFLLLCGAIAGITYSVLINWFSANKTDLSAYGEIISSKLNNGNYRIETGIFNRSHSKLASKVWEASEIDDELKRRLSGKTKIRVEI